MTTTLAEKIPISGTRYSRFTARPMTGSFGALISGIQIAEALTDEHPALGRRFGAIQEQGYVGIFNFGQSHRLMHRVSFHDHWRPA